MNRKNSKKGFTLVEVIVVLVILAILAAIMIPAMTGWIDKAKERQVIVEARAALLACQTIASEKYGEIPADTTWDDDDTAAALTLSGMTGHGTMSAVSMRATDNVITNMTYSQGSGGYSVTYTADGGFGATSKVG